MPPMLHVKTCAHFYALADLLFTLINLKAHAYGQRYSGIGIRKVHIMVFAKMFVILPKSLCVFAC